MNRMGANNRLTLASDKNVKSVTSRNLDTRQKYQAAAL